MTKIYSNLQSMMPVWSSILVYICILYLIWLIFFYIWTYFKAAKQSQDKPSHWKSPLSFGDLGQAGRTSVHPGKHVQLRTEMKDWRPQASWINDESRRSHYDTVGSTGKDNARKKWMLLILKFVLTRRTWLEGMTRYNFCPLYKTKKGTR